MDIVLSPMDTIANFVGQLDSVEATVIHRFTKGLYSRELRLPAGSLNVSKIHKSEHQFVISKGHVEVWSKEKGSVHYVAPYIGITEPGTQRAVFAHEDTVWLTFHPTELTDPAEIEREIIQEPFPGSITIPDEFMKQLKEGS